MVALIMSALYVWCQVNKDTIVQFWFGTQFKVRKLLNMDIPTLTFDLSVYMQAMYLPWILLAFNFVLSGR